jgi:hypothetical protein
VYLQNGRAEKISVYLEHDYQIYSTSLMYIGSALRKIDGNLKEYLRHQSTIFVDRNIIVSYDLIKAILGLITIICEVHSMISYQ